MHCTDRASDLKSRFMTLKNTYKVFSSHPFFAIITVAFIITAIFSLKGALQDVHWDAPIYLFRGKYIAQLLSSYHTHAEQISALAGSPESVYWAFIRLGNPVLLGLITFLFGSDILSIKIMSWMYTFMLACGVIFSVLFSKKIVGLFETGLSNKSVLLGGLISGVLYIGSDIFRYLSGNLIGEVPAIFFASASILALINAYTNSKPSLAVLSGLLGFCLYFVKMDAVWVYASFIIIFNIFIIIQKPEQKTWWYAFLISALVAMACYVIYALYFYPLANPFNLIRFAESLKAGNVNIGGYPAFPQLFVVCGLLLTGWAISTFLNIKKPVFWLAFAWFFLLILPYLSALINNRILQVRMLSLIMLPLMIGSTLGWATLIERNKIPQQKNQFTLYVLVFISTALFAISQAESYKVLRNLPGGWRLQYVKKYLSPPSFQRKNFPLKELETISKLVYSSTDRNLIFWNKDDNPEHDEYIYILRYLADGKMKIVNYFQDLAPTEGECNFSMRYTGIEPVVYCTDASYEKNISDLINEAETWAMTSGSCSPVLVTQNDSILFQSERFSICPWPPHALTHY